MAFPVTCPACGKAFQLATEIYERKVAGKIVSIKCKQCQAGIRVDATTPGELKVVGATPAGGSGDVSVGPKPPEAPKAAPAAGAERPQPAPMRMRQPTLIGMVNPQAALLKQPAAQPAPAPAPAAAKAPVLWAIDSGGAGDDRELDENEIRREIEAGRLTPQTLAWRDGMAEWLEIEKIPELRAFLEKPREVEKPREAPKAAARAAERRPTPREVPRAKEQTASFQEDADSENTMVYDRSAPNAALEPFAAPDSDKTMRVMVGDAPPPPPLPAAGRPAAFAKTVPLADPPPPPLPPAGRPAPPAQPAPPLPAARPLPDAPPMQATPLTPPVQAAPPAARPQAPPPAPAAPALPRLPAQPPVLAAVPWGDALPSAKPATPGLPTAPYGPDPFAVAATTDLDFPSPRSKKPLVIAVVAIVAAVGIGIAILSSSSPPVANIAAPPPVPVETQATPKPAEPAPTSESTRNDDSPGTSAPGAQPQPQTGNGNFSDLFSKGAEKAKGSGSTKGFDEAKAREALAAVLDAAAACKEPGAQMGQTTATVTFESSGAVSGVTVGAPFAGTSTGTCIINAFKRAKTTPFSGLPGTVSQTISIR